MGIQKYISTVAETGLRNQNYSDISVMPASRKQFTTLFGIDVSSKEVGYGPHN